MVAKRLESLGALTHGDRRATESRDLSKYNIDTKYGRSALEIVLGSVVSQRQPIVHSEEYNQGFFESKLIFVFCSCKLMSICMLYACVTEIDGQLSDIFRPNLAFDQPSYQITIIYHWESQ